MAERKVVPFDEFYYQLKLMYLFQKHPVYRQKFFLAVQHSCLSLKITLGLAPSCNFLATNTRASGLLEKISGNISVPWYIIPGVELVYET
jgi:hypothetical protein